jgi:hypothetical protein
MDVTDRGVHAGMGSRGPSQAEVLDLIRRADEHRLGQQFLAEGMQDAVAATFGVSAYVVDAARDHLARQSRRGKPGA